jgi:hypothetical protein
MSSAIGDLEDAGQAVKDGFEHVDEAVQKELGGTPAHQAGASPATPQDCGPMGCEIEEDPAQA